MKSTIESLFTSLWESGKLLRREAQAEMSAYIADRLADGKIAIAEGGTGIGKSYAALIAALEARQCWLSTMRIENPEASLPPIVYSTGTVALQEQIVGKDLPFLAEVLPYPIEFAVAKGRGRYFCPLRAEKASGDVKTLDLFEEEKEDVSEAGAGAARKLMQRFHNGGWDGDLDALSSPLTPEATAAVTISGAACQKSQCKFYEDCPFFKARKHLRNMDVIVVNHDLLLCDIKAGGGRVLPGKPEQTLYLIDEAHQFPDKAVNQLGGRAHLASIKERAGSISKAINHAQRIMLSMPDGIKDLLDQVGTCIKPIVEAAEETELVLESNMDGSQWLMENGCPDTLAEPVKRLSLALSNMCSQMEKLIAELSDHKSMDKSRVEFAFHQSTLVEYADAVGMFLADDPADAPPTARWAEVDEKGVSLNAFPTFPSHRLAAMFWGRVMGAACFSATLRSLRSFGKFKMDTGLALVGDRCDNGMVAKSDFDYRRSTLFLAGEDRPSPNSQDPKEQAEYKRFVCSMIARAIRSEQYLGILVIFTSRALMEQVYEMLDGKGMPGTSAVLKQGDMSRSRLIAKHKERINKGKKSVIFGLSSFREGVDLPGELCSCVIIPRLPFAVPTTPMEKARVAWLTRTGRKSFVDYALPACSTWLTQMVGRLIRTHDDTGVILVLDKRMSSTWYGERLRKSLPPFHVRYL